MFFNGDMYKVKSMGPSTEPWGTPYFSGRALDIIIAIYLNRLLSILQVGLEPQQR